MIETKEQLLKRLNGCWITALVEACHVSYKTVKKDDKEVAARGYWIENQIEEVKERNKEVCEKAYQVGYKDGVTAAAEKLADAAKKILDLEATVTVLKAAQTKALTNIPLPPPQLQQARKT